MQSRSEMSCIIVVIMFKTIPKKRRYYVIIPPPPIEATKTVLNGSFFVSVQEVIFSRRKGCSSLPIRSPYVNISTPFATQECFYMTKIRLFTIKMLQLPTELPTLSINDKTKEESILSLLSPLIIDDETRARIQAVFLDEMRLGLAVDPESVSSLQMENTYISELINGEEEGTYLALDLGGTNFRVILITLIKGKIEDEEVSHYNIPKDVFLGEGSKLFDFLALSIDDFMKKRGISHQHYNLGFTFSFPMIQKRVDVGILTSWTKSFNCPGVVGEDVVHLLNEAIQRNTDLDITVNSVLNDTTGTLVMGSYEDKRCAIGMILGTGHNACYLETVSNVSKWKGQHEEREIIIDIEWGSFGDNGVLNFLRTKWDNLVDDKSLLQKSFTFEKYIGGKYLGDLVREILVTLATEHLLCQGPSPTLETHGALKTSAVAMIEREAFEGGSSYTKQTLSSLGLSCVADDDVKIVQYVCGIVSYRAALLVSSLTSLLLEKMKREHCTIAIDGSLFEHHPRFKPLMEYLTQTFSPQRSFSLLLTRDGSGKGAGLVAAIEERIRLNQQTVQ